MQRICQRLLDVVNVLAGKRVQYSLDVMVRKHCNWHLGFSDLNWISEDTDQYEIDDLDGISQSAEGERYMLPVPS